MDEGEVDASSYNSLRECTLAVEKLNYTVFIHDQFEDIVDFIVKNFKLCIPYNRIGVAVLSDDGQSLRAFSARSDKRIMLGEGYENALAATRLKRIIASSEPRMLNDLKVYNREHPHSDATRLILKEGIRSNVTLPLIVKDECVGVVSSLRCEQMRMRTCI